MNLPESFAHIHTPVALDTETTGLRWWKDRIFAIQLAWRDTFGELQVLVVDLRDETAMRWARAVIPTIQTVVGFNLKFDFHFLRQAGIKVQLDRIHDTSIYAALLDEHRLSFSLDDIAMTELGLRKVDIYRELADHFGGNPTREAQMPNLHRAPWSMIQGYMEQDARLPLLLFENFWPMLHEKDSLGDDLMKVAGVEMALLPVLLDIESHGIRIDADRAEQAVTQVSGIIDEQQKAINHLAGKVININSPLDMQTVLGFRHTPGELIGEPGTWDGPGIFKITPKSNRPSIDADFLRRVPHPAGKMVLELRELKKMRDTFLLGHVLGHNQNGIVYPNYNQTKGEAAGGGELGTISGRLSVNDPALQQIPKRNEKIASIVRALFLPDDGQKWWCRDYAQMDFRMMAHYAKNQEILAAYAANPDLDFHQLVADMTGLPRKKTVGIKGDAKTVNLGLAFGMGAGKLAEQMDLPYSREMGYSGKEHLKAGEEALELFANYHARVPGIKAILDRATSVARARGFIKTILGRRTRFPGRALTHKAGAMLFQGSAAEANKVALIRCHRILKGEDARILLNVHDEINSSMPGGAAGERLSSAMKEEMETFDGVRSPFTFCVPIRTSVGMADNWWDASK